MGKSIEIQTDQDKHGTPRVRVSDGYGDSGWIYIHQARPGEDPQDWLARAVAMDGVALDALGFAQDNESPAYLNGVDFGVRVHGRPPGTLGSPGACRALAEHFAKSHRWPALGPARSAAAPALIISPALAFSPLPG